MKISRLMPIALTLTSLTTMTACTTVRRVEVAPDGGAPGESSSATVPGEHDVASFCAALCDRQGECDHALDHQTCKNDCYNRQAAVFPKLRADVVDLIVECFAEKDCKSVLGGEVVTVCAAEGIASVAPSDAAAAYCTAYEKAKKNCGVTTTKASCLEQAKLYDDDAIAEAHNCASRPCSDIDTCVSAAFGGFGGTTPAPSAPACTESQFSDLGSCASCAAGPCCEQAAACAEDSTCRSLMSACAYASGSSPSCYAGLESASKPTRQLLGAVYQCASTSCSSSCGFVNP